MKDKIQNRILIVHEKAKIASYLADKLTSWGCNVDKTANGYSALEKVGYFSYTIVFVSTTLPLINYKDVTSRILKEYPDIFQVIVDSENKLSDEEVKNASADFYIPDPMDDHLISNVLYEIAGRRPDLEEAFQNLPLVKYDFERIVGKDHTMKKLYKILKKLSKSSVTVLIQGESGTGKELTAKAIHYYGDRKNNPFVAVSCAAIPETLLESELFGHEKGSFTGAIAEKIGTFEQADTGTIFLDEIGEMSPALQAKLLRVLEESEFQRVGGIEKKKVDIRIISATNRDLWKMTKKGLFRQDLYYRLSAFPLHLPPLRERKSDIPLLTRYFIRKHHQRAGKNICQIDREALEILNDFKWEGNIRELENVIERSLVMSENNIILKKDLPEYPGRSFRFGNGCCS